VQCSPNDFQSYLEDFDEYSFDHLDLFNKQDYQPPFYLDINKGEDISCLEKDSYDNVFHLPLTILSCYVTKGVVGKHSLCLKFSIRKRLLLELKGRLNTSRGSLLSQSSNLPLRNFQ